MCLRALVHALLLGFLLLSGRVSSAEDTEKLVDAKAYVPDLILDLRYATAANFLGRAVYPPNARCLLREEAAQKLREAAAILRTRGFRLIAFDCYRPLSVQREMWRRFPQRGYVADPRFGGQHNRATAVDVGLATLEGKPVEMPSDFDTFSIASHQHYMGGTARARGHRDTLREAMAHAGFVPLRMEWWHFALPKSSRYRVIDELLAPTP